MNSKEKEKKRRKRMTTVKQFRGGKRKEKDDTKRIKAMSEKKRKINKA